MKLLVIDDSDTARLTIGAMLRRLGHEVSVANDGEQGLALFRQARPDAVFVDVVMPGISGYEVAERIKAEAADTWIPVTFTSGLGDSDHLSKAEDSGADGYLVKPIKFGLLGAKMRALERELALRRQIQSQNAELQNYYRQAEEENRLALALMERRLDKEALADRRVRQWLAPAKQFSGDAIVAARTPGDVLNLMLADSTGHGLTSALAVLPVITTFYAMTAKGFSIGAIVREMNKSTKRFLTADRFVAAVLASIDYKEGLLRIWNGGCPTCFVLGDDGQVLARFESKHPPLGILTDAELDASQQVFTIDRHSQLVMASDGVTEAPGTAGELFGEANLLSTLATVSPEMRLLHFMGEFVTHWNGSDALDDVSILIADCDREAATECAAQVSPVAPPSSTSGAWSVALSLSAEQIRSVDTVPMLLEISSQFGLAEVHAGKVFMILSELITNAVDHGLLRLDSALKADGMDAYLDQRAERLAGLQGGRVEVALTRQFDPDDALVITCKDTGDGFDYQSVLKTAAGAGAAPYGRGLALIRGLGAEIAYQGNGSEVVVRVPLETS
jgi:two-component system, HptB-dependent secretion and biofilm response regulator